MQLTNSLTGDPGPSGNWGFNGTIASNRNAIAGTMSLFSSTTAPISGAAAGRFYGPDFDEIGIAFQGESTNPLFAGTTAVGVLVGRKNNGVITGNNPSLLDLQFDETFLSAQKGFAYPASNGTGSPSEFSSNYLMSPNQFRLSYSAAEKSFSLSDDTASPNRTIISTSQPPDATLTDGKFTAYSKSSADEEIRWRLYKPTGSNSEIALTYSSFFNLSYATRNSDGSWAYRNVWTPFGVATPNASMPTSGSANYAGILHGTASDGLIGSELADLGGTVNLAVNFGTAAVTGTVNPIITYRSGTTYDLGTSNLFEGRYFNPGVNQPGFAGSPNISARFGGTLSNPVGQAFDALLGGIFYGPNYSELTGTFSGKYAPLASSGLSGLFWGSFGATKTGGTPSP